MCAMSKAILASAAALVVSVMSVDVARGDVVWADNFDVGETAGNAPTSDFAGGAVGTDYTIATASGGSYLVSSVGDTAPSLAFNDPNAAATATLTVLSTQWAPLNFSASNNLLVTEFDFRVDDFNSGIADAAPRFVLRHANAGNQQIIVAFGRTTATPIADGDDPLEYDLALAAGVPTTGTSFLPPTDANAIGLNPGTGWAPGFDFGNYNADTSFNDTGDQFYRIMLTYDFNTGAVTGSATNTATNESATFARTMTAGLLFNTAASSFLTATTASSSAQSYLDNIRISVVPEPGTSAVLLGGAGLMAIRRCRRQ
jgi:hypothetical protein